MDTFAADEWLNEHADCVEKWVCEKASSEFQKSLRDKLLKYGVSRRSSVATDLQQLLKNSSPVKSQKLLPTKRPLQVCKRGKTVILKKKI